MKAVATVLVGAVCMLYDPVLPGIVVDNVKFVVAPTAIEGTVTVVEPVPVGNVAKIGEFPTLIVTDVTSAGE